MEMSWSKVWLLEVEDAVVEEEEDKAQAVELVLQVIDPQEILTINLEVVKPMWFKEQREVVVQVMKNIDAFIFQVIKDI